MGIYSNKAKEAFLEANNLFDKKSESYYKSKMFYGNAQVLIDAKSESEAKVLQARAINDFDTFCKCYKVDNGEKLNGIVVKPVGESSNEFIACTTGIDKSRSFEHIVIREGKIISAHKDTIVVEESDQVVNDKDLDSVKDKHTPPGAKEEPEKQEEVKESNLAIDF
jgi:hypothetical protein